MSSIGSTGSEAVRILPRLLLLILVISACSQAVGRPTAFEAMEADQVGCEVAFGTEEKRFTEPLSVGDSETIEPNEWTSFHIWRTARDIAFSVRTERTGSSGSYLIDGLPDDQVIARQDFIDQANPGYRITCWRG